MLKRIIPFLLAISWLFYISMLFGRIQLVSSNRTLEIVALILIAISYSIRYWNKTNARFTDTIKAVLIVFWCGLQISFAAGILYEPIVIYAFYLMGAVWYIFEMIDLAKGRTKGLHLVLFMGASLMAAQVVLRWFHWPFAIVAMLASWFLLTLGFIAEFIALLRQYKEATS